MTADGRSVVFISHKLGEVLAIADRITVMRRGKVTAAGARRRPTTSTADLARLMVGRDVLEILERAPSGAGRGRPRRPATSTADNDRGLPALRGVSLEVRAGEIVGIAAVAGNGQSELAEVITGLRPCHGSVTDRRRGGRQPARPATRSAQGVAHVPEDRTGVGSVAEPVDRRQPDHEALPATRRSPAAGSSTTRRRARSRPGLKDAYAIAAPSIDTQARLLSGGNLQRLILAREIDAGPRADGRRPADARPRRRRDRGGPPRRCSSGARRAPRSC